MTIYQPRLPDDPLVSKAMLSATMEELAQRDDELAAQTAIVAVLQSQIADRDTEIEALKLLIAKLRRMHFGRKSEKVAHHIDQLELKLEELQADAGDHSLAGTKTPGRNTGKPSRKPIPAHLPREECTYQPDISGCPACGASMRYLGEDVSEQLEYVPASFKVIRHIRPKYTCRCCDQIVQEPAANRPIARGLAGPGLLAHVLVSKFADHLPLYRQSVIYARQGVELDRATLADWVGASSALLRPLVDAIRRHVLAADRLHADDTPVPVLAPDAARPRRDACGPMSGTTDPADPLLLLLSGLPIPLIGKGGIHNRTWPISEVCCKPTPIPASRGSMTPATSSKRLAGLTPVGSCMIYMSPDRLVSLQKCCVA